MTRCFVAFELTEATRGYLRERLEPLHAHLRDELGWNVRLVPPANWHVTLLFFKALEAEQRQVVWDEVRRHVHEGWWRDLRFAWEGLSLWPDPRRPNLLCLAASPYESHHDWPLLSRLDEDPFSRAQAKHVRKYRPHVTVMRFRPGGTRPTLAAWQQVQADLAAVDPARIAVDRVSFLLSTVSREAPIYPRETTEPLAPEGG